MDRRSLLTSFTRLGQTGNLEKNTALPINGGLSPYTGTWNYATAAHLLRRATFGPTHEMIKQAVSDGLNLTITKLLSKISEPAPPVIYTDAPVDPHTSKGETWVDKPFTPGVQGLQQLWDNSLRAWILENMFNEGVSITEKMMLFWHNHFVISEIFDPRYSYNYLKTIRKNVIGDFRQMAKDITIDAGMLVYLNGNVNNKRAPNENYGRELMELFTLGKGALAGPGDYTTYTEQDVMAMAKALTGWTIRVTRNADTSATYQVQYVDNLHDVSDKQLSARFSNKVIKNAGIKEYENVIDILFERRETATFICRKLYRYFVYYKVDAAIENDIVNGLADILIANNFDISSVLKSLLSSDHFYSIEALGCMIRPPYEFIFNTLKAMHFKTSTDLETRYRLFLSIFNSTTGMQQVYFDIPSVAGWTPYYQEPGFHEIWINSVTYPLRVAFTNQGVNKQIRPRGVAGTYGLDLVEYISGFSDPGNVNNLIADIVNHLLPQAIYQNQLDYLKTKLLANTTEAQWTTSWNNYKANPNNAAARTVIDTRLKPMFLSLLAMPEYYLS